MDKLLNFLNKKNTDNKSKVEDAINKIIACNNQTMNDGIVNTEPHIIKEKIISMEVGKSSFIEDNCINEKVEKSNISDEILIKIEKTDVDKVDIGQCKEDTKGYIDTERYMLNIDINLIVANKNQPRKIFEEKEIQNLSESIKENGIIQPIIVRVKDDGLYEIVAGERRLRASKLAGLTEAPCVIINVDDERSAVLALIENIQRRDLTFFEEAEALRCILKDGGITQEQLSSKIGKSQSTIANKLRLLALPNKVKLLILKNGITERHSRALLKIVNDEMKEKVLLEIIDKKLNVEQSERLIETYVSGKNGKKKITQIFIVKDVRIFLNTINRAIDVMKTSGIDAKIEKKEKEDYILYQIKIPTKKGTEVGRKIS